MREIGFWDYTCPGNGSLERYTKADWDELLDDMVVGGCNSFVRCVKWLTTGYRSQLPWLDQDPPCTARLAWLQSARTLRPELTCDSRSSKKGSGL